MRQSSAGLAQLPTGRTTASRVPDPAAATPAPAREPVAALHGVMTGLANIVNEHLGRLTIGPQATRFLRHLERLTFGNAGWHRRAGRSDPGLWCPYDHANWAETLGLSSSALTHLRTRLMEAEIIWYTPDPEHRGHGALGWSFDFAAWKPLRWGGARAGAGRPWTPPPVKRHARAPAARPKELMTALPGAAEEPPGATARVRLAYHQSASLGAGTVAASGAERTIQDVNGGGAREPQGEFKMSTSRIQDVNDSQSRRQRAQIKMSTSANQDVNGATRRTRSPSGIYASRKKGFSEEREETEKKDRCWRIWRGEHAAHGACGVWSTFLSVT